MHEEEKETQEAARNAVAIIVKNYGRTLADPGELLTEAWIAALRARSTFNPDKAKKGVYSWMVQSAVFACREFIRRAHVHPSGMTGFPRNNLNDIRIGSIEEAADRRSNNPDRPYEPRMVSIAGGADPPSDPLIKFEEISTVRTALQVVKFEPSERVVLYGRFWDEYLLKTIAIGLDVTESRVSQIETNALRKLQIYYRRPDWT